MRNGDFSSHFRLRPTRGAKVSEISEATAASATPPEERVNFHIGNPVQEGRLSSAYLRAVLGLDIGSTLLSQDNPDGLLRALDWREEQRPFLNLCIEMIRASGPYLPRGGFTRNAPSQLALAFADWLTKQQEPLTYDLGKSTGRREIVIGSGGVYEALRVLFHAISSFLVEPPGRILLFHSDLPAHLLNFQNLRPERLPQDESAALERLRFLFMSAPLLPTYILLGAIPDEETRRGLRTLAVNHPLFFIEINDAPNHLSLAREARLVDRVLRFLTPGIFSSRLRGLSIVFAAGNADYLSLFETIHFQLKGTPSASEAELLTFLLSRLKASDAGPAERLPVEPPLETAELPGGAENTLTRHAFRIESRLTEILDSHLRPVESALNRLSSNVGRASDIMVSRTLMKAVDKLHDSNAADLLSELDRNPNNPGLYSVLADSALASFTRHHPEYDSSSCTMVSGSARTALSLMGFHCGIRDVIIPDLSWTYEHCFPSTQAVPLSDNRELDAYAVLRTVDKRITSDPNWNAYGAFILNNPHNATGSVFDAETVEHLLLGLLDRGIRVIDDLSYQNLAPVSTLPEILSLRQHADRLLGKGRITAEQAARVITVHSMSKTDCLAGARLCVTEIRQPDLRDRFREVLKSVPSNIGAMLLSYLFYRNPPEVVRAFWRLRNCVLEERMKAIEDAARSLPPQRNPFAIKILPPRGSMYPIMELGSLPAGLSLDWLADGLARQGIGMVPLSTFARTQEGFETGRTSFRLTLGGTDGAPALRSKTRRVLIDLNRLISQEGARYSRKTFGIRRTLAPPEGAEASWSIADTRLRKAAVTALLTPGPPPSDELRDERVRKKFTDEFIPDRLAVYRQRFLDRSAIAAELIAAARTDSGRELGARLEREFMKDNLTRRQEAFRLRSFDRTVHPTQVYSLKAEDALSGIIHSLVRGTTPPETHFTRAAREMLSEFLGLTVGITSGDEANEVILDLDAHIAAENFSDLQSAGLAPTLLSFWGDWDGSNRPSGQGHRLVGAVLIENVQRLSGILRRLASRDSSAGMPADLLADIERLPAKTRRFADLMHEITSLTHQLEKRYRGILPFSSSPGRLRKIGMRLHLASDPVTSLWHHNDRLERRMLELRRQRREALEYYFALNKRLRKQLKSSIPSLIRNLTDTALARESVLYRDLLQRFVLTPRIHQSMITAQDPFAIDTTVFNIFEINEISGRFGNPGMVLALQVSMASKPEALVELDRKVRARREHILRDQPDIALPSVWLVPLFEVLDAVKGLRGYLEKIWEYALQSRRLNQETRDRFAEVIEEIFIAGSDLSQQIGQPAGARAYQQAKHELMHWLAENGLSRDVRLKLGCGEPMQRQGGYYNRISGEAAFRPTNDAEQRFAPHLRESTRRSTVYATTPMLGVFSGGDLRTLQSMIAEQLRYLPVSEAAQVLHHLAHAQRDHRSDLTRALEELSESRFANTLRSEQALARLTIGSQEDALAEFLNIAQENFRQILYGREEDVVGIHIISYFIARTTPPLRDRPTIRPGQGGPEQGSRILERIAETIPFSRYGSRLRAIAHNQSQTAILGVNQLTTGLFRALDTFSRSESIEGDGETFLADHVLPHLPVYEILQSLRLYHDVEQRYIGALERAFPAGNSALLALREDFDAMIKQLPLFQQELLRRHGIEIGDFFEGSHFIPSLLPTLRPDLAVLLQPDIFNTDIERLRGLIGGSIDRPWLDSTDALLGATREIQYWREKAWVLLEQPVFQRVEAFVELAISLYSIISKDQTRSVPPPSRPFRPSAGVSGFLRTSRGDDEMREFLSAAMEYLSMASGGMVEVPANIIRAMQDIERIAKIEEQALSPAGQDRLKFYLLQIARVAGESG